MKMLRNEFFANQKFVINKVRKEGRKEGERKTRGGMAAGSKDGEGSPRSKGARLDWY